MVLDPAPKNCQNINAENYSNWIYPAEAVLYLPFRHHSPDPYQPRTWHLYLPLLMSSCHVNTNLCLCACSAACACSLLQKKTQICTITKFHFFFYYLYRQNTNLRCQLGTADPTKKKFLLSSVILYHTYNLHIHIYIKTYIHIYNSMYRDNRDKKWLAFIKIDFLFFLLLTIFTS